MIKSKFLLFSAVLLAFNSSALPAYARSHASHHSATHSMTHHVVTHSTVQNETAHTTTQSVKHETTAKTLTTNFKEASPNAQAELLNSKQRYSRTESSNIFANNNIKSGYQRFYHRQSVITNPWFWMFMINHHRVNNDHAKNTQYLTGYKAGYQAGQTDLKVHSRNHQNLTSQQESSHNQSWQNGYYDGYSDAVAQKQ